MLKRLLLVAAAVLLVPLTASAQWTFEGIFPQDTLAVNSGHGIAVDPDGKVWFQPFSATDSVQVPDLGNEYRATRVIYVYNADGTPASFSPLKFVDLPGGERDTLGGLVELDANGDKVWEGKSGRGLRADSDGNIIVSQWRYLYKINYQTGAGMAKNIFDDYCSLSAPATDGLGNVFVAPVCPGPPIRALDGDLQLIDNAVDVTHGFSRSFEVSADGNTIYWAGYTNHAVLMYQRPDEFSSYDSLGVVLQGFDSESLSMNPVTGNLWASAGSPNDLPNRYPDVTTNWLPQTWYEFSLDSLVPNEAPPAPMNLFSWNNSPDWADGRPRGLAFSPDGEMAYVTQFNQIAPSIQVFKAAPFEQPDFTVRDINAIAQANIDILKSGGADLQSGDIPGLIFNDLSGSEVSFQAVVMSDPLSSGLGNPANPGDFPSRIHVFVRDINAATLGPAGMGIQLVDGNAQTSGIMDVTVGDVVQITGTFSPFGTTMQIAPTTVELLGTLEDFGLTQSVMDPIVITTGDANANIADGQYQANWDNFANLRGQYVRLEGVTMQRRNIANTRVDWLVSSDDGTTILNFYDTGIQFRNDQSDYPDIFNIPQDTFVPPPPGARLNLQGFLTFNGDDPFAVGVPTGAIVSINPMEPSDLEITEAPPIVSSPSRPDFVPTTDPITVTTDVTVDPSRNLSSVMLKFTTSRNATEQMFAMTNTSGTTYEAQIPAQGDGDFVTYVVEATDSEGAVSVSDPVATRFLVDGINEISDIQTTPDDGVGSSPFAGVTTNLLISGRVQSDPAISGLYVIQDKVDLAGWSGIFLSFSGTAPTLNRGDVVTITSGTITESFGVTQLSDPVMTVNSTGGDTFGYKTVTTDVLQNQGVAEAHEGMLLRFENVTVTSVDRFGEWSFSSDGTADNAVSADDASAAISSSFNSDTFVDGASVGGMQGIWWYSFGNFKLVPESPDDVTDVNAVSIEEVDGTLPNTFGLHQNYPNPFNPVTTIAYDVPTNAHVTLQVFDMMGREITTLVDEPHNSGTFRASFDARDLASGMYIYRLTAGTQVLTKTMVLLK